mgnify:CR=1 FL=1
MNESRNAVEVFLKSWQVYQEIISNNYMFHFEIANAVRDALVDFKPGKNLTILDLGCGDGSMTLNLLPPERIASYIGCDLSKPALDIAQRRIDLLNINAKLACDDMLKVAIEQPDNSADLIFSSYAVHHLNASNKLRLIENLARSLNSGGKFILIDIFREPTEDRAAYMQNYLQHVTNNWLALSSESQQLVVNHAKEFDFPELPAFFQSVGSKSGLNEGQQLAKHMWHEAWAFTKCV